MLIQRESIVFPPPVRAGQTVAVVAPAGPVPQRELALGLDVIASQFDVRVADDIHRARGYLAGDDERRADEFNRALRDPDIRALWVARGGYGTMRILPLLDGAALRADPKPILGFSDATALLSWAYHNGVIGVHAPVVIQLPQLSVNDHNWVFELLGGDNEAILATGLKPFGEVSGLSGPLLGGNLSLVAHLAATPWAVDLHDALFVVEDVGERPYALDRYLTSLRMSGALGSCRGAIVGTFDRCLDGDGREGREAVDTVTGCLGEAGLSGLVGAPIGHGACNRAWPFGGRARLEAAQIRLLDRAVD